MFSADLLVCCDLAEPVSWSFTSIPFIGPDLLGFLVAVFLILSVTTRSLLFDRLVTYMELALSEICDAKCPHFRKEASFFTAFFLILIALQALIMTPFSIKMVGAGVLPAHLSFMLLFACSGVMAELYRLKLKAGTLTPAVEDLSRDPTPETTIVISVALFFIFGNCIAQCCVLSIRVWATTFATSLWFNCLFILASSAHETIVSMIPSTAPLLFVLQGAADFGLVFVSFSLSVLQALLFASLGVFYLNAAVLMGKTL